MVQYDDLSGKKVKVKNIPNAIGIVGYRSIDSNSGDIYYYVKFPDGSDGEFKYTDLIIEPNNTQESMETYKMGGKAQREKVKKVLHEYKMRTLKSSSGEKVTDRDQAIAIALNEAGLSNKKECGGMAESEMANSSGIYNSGGYAESGGIYNPGGYMEKGGFVETTSMVSIQEQIVKIDKGLASTHISESLKSQLRKSKDKLQVQYESEKKEAIESVRKNKALAKSQKEEAERNKKALEDDIKSQQLKLSKQRKLKKGAPKKGVGMKLKAKPSVKKSGAKKIVLKKGKSKSPIKRVSVKKGKFAGYPKKVKSFNLGRDLVRDKGRVALPPGKRISASGNVYYENRPGHADISPRHKLEGGGTFYDKGGKTDFDFILINDYGETGKILLGTSQGENKKEALKLGKKFGQGYDLVAVKGNIIWIRGRIQGIELEDGTEVLYNDREYFDSYSMGILRKNKYEKGGSLYDKGGKPDYWIAGSIEHEGSLRRKAKEMGLINGDEKLSYADLDKLQALGGVWAKKANEARNLMNISKGKNVKGRSFSKKS